MSFVNKEVHQATMYDGCHGNSVTSRCRVVPKFSDSERTVGGIYSYHPAV